MTVQVLDSAKRHLIEGYYFYEKKAPGLGSYFLNSLFAEIDSLVIHGGIHSQVHGFHRKIAKRFPFAIYYLLVGDEARVHAVLDCRRNPLWIRRKLRES